MISSVVPFISVIGVGLFGHSGPCPGPFPSVVIFDKGSTVGHTVNVRATGRTAHKA